jgi:hypothetical protein
MTSYGMCTCAAGCARNPMADSGAFGHECDCWCHTQPEPLAAPADASLDRLLAALAEARARKERAEQDIRLLLAYAREIIVPRPYRLADLAKAAGLSISGVRAAYTEGDIERAASLAGGSAQRHLDAVVAALLAEGQHAPACEPHTAA